MTVRVVEAERTRWRVWPVVPAAGVGDRGEQISAGWLAMENEHGEKRRLFPLPEGWEHWSDERLRLTIRMAATRSSLPRPEPPLPG